MKFVVGRVQITSGKGWMAAPQVLTPISWDLRAAFYFPWPLNKVGDVSYSGILQHPVAISRRKCWFGVSSKRSFVSLALFESLSAEAS